MAECLIFNILKPKKILFLAVSANFAVPANDPGFFCKQS
jgi:hypothetical protein